MTRATPGATHGQAWYQHVVTPFLEKHGHDRGGQMLKHLKKFSPFFASDWHLNNYG
jgi:hypothetical protein